MTTPDNSNGFKYGNHAPIEELMEAIYPPSQRPLLRPNVEAGCALVGEGKLNELELSHRECSVAIIVYAAYMKNGNGAKQRTMSNDPKFQEWLTFLIEHFYDGEVTEEARSRIDMRVDAAVKLLRDATK